MNAAKVTQSGAGEATEMQQEASEATATRQCARGAEQTQIRARMSLSIFLCMGVRGRG